MKMNLQYFAEEVETDKGEEVKPITFNSQEELDSMIAKRAARAEKSALQKYKESDEYKELISFKEKQMTDTDKTQAEIEKLKQAANEAEILKRENQSLKNRTLITGIEDPDQVEFIQFKVEKMVTDTLDFPEALKKFKEENPTLFGTKESGSMQQRTKGTTTSTNATSKKYESSPWYMHGR